MPYNLEAEQAVLGSILIDPSSIDRAMDYLRPDSFFKPEHRDIYSIMISMFTAGETMDIITVLEAAKAQGVFDTDEAAKAYLAQLVEVVPSASNIESYARIVVEKYYLRCLIGVAGDIIDNTAGGHGDASTLLDSAEQRIFEIRQGKDTRGLVKFSDIMVDVYDRLQKLSGEDRRQLLGEPSGFSDLDDMLTGLNKSDLILLAARPAMGKTSFALNIATNVAKKTDKAVAIFSLEMTKDQVVTRMLSSEASIPGHQLRTGELQGEDWVRLSQAASILSNCKLYVDDSSGITVPEMKAKLRRIKNLGLVVIDYLQLMSSGKRSENRVQEVSEMTRNLKIMAKDLDVPVLTLSQLSRSPDSRADHRPMLSDLRESGSIEQDADQVLFLYRDEYYKNEKEDPTAVETGTSEVIVAKNRHGELGTVKLAWFGEFTQFTSLEMHRSE